MITSENIAVLNEYLEENHHKNRQFDFTHMSKVGRHFDPLTDQEPDIDRLAEDARSLVIKPSSSFSHQLAIEKGKRVCYVCMYVIRRE